MKNILVPIDFSNSSGNAEKYAVSLAKTFEASVTLINVVAPSVMVDDSVLASVLITQAEVITGNRELMEKEIESLSKIFKMKIEGLVEEGFPTDIIYEIAKEKDTSLIVMGMKGRGESNSVFGSTTTAVIRKSNYPVFVIPENAHYQVIDTITFATDFNPETDSSCYSFLMELTKKYNAFIQILNVQKNENKLNDAEFIGKMRTHFAFADSKHSFNTIEDNNVIEGINKFIEENPCDVLVMLAHKHSFFERMLGRVHTKTMSYETKIPFLILQNK